MLSSIASVDFSRSVRHVMVLVAMSVWLVSAAEVIAGPTADASKRPQLVIDAKGLSGDPVVSVDVSSDGRLVAAASGKEVRVWTLPEGRLYATLRGYREPGGFHGGTINVVKFFPGSSYLAVAVSDNTPKGSTRVFNLTRPDRIHQLLPGHKGCTKGLSVSPTGDYLATYGCDVQFITYRRSADRDRWVIDRATRWEEGAPGMRVTPVDVDHTSPLDGLRRFDFVGKGDWFLATYDSYIDNPNTSTTAYANFQGAPSGGGRKLLLTDLSNGQGFTNFRDWPQDIHDTVHQLHKLKLPIDPRSESVQQTAQDYRVGGRPWYAVTGKDRRFAASGAVNYWAASYSNDDPADAVTYQGHRFTPSAISMGLARQSQGDALASGDFLGETHVWSGATGERIARFTPNVTRFYAVRFSSDGRSLTYSTRPYDSSKYGYNHFGPLTHAFEFPQRKISLVAKEAVSADADGHRVRVRGGSVVYTVAASGGELAYRDGGKWTSLVPRYEIHGVPFPAPQWMDLAHFGSVYCYAEVPGSAGMGRPRVIIGSDKGGLEEYEIVRAPRGGKPVLSCRRRFIGHTARVTGIDFSNDGRAMASCSWDGTIKLWSLAEQPPNGDVDFFARGTAITGVLPNSAAGNAGIRPGDIVTRFDDAPYFERLQGMAKGRYRPGQRVSVDYLRLRAGASLTASENHSGDTSKFERRRATVELVDAPTYVEPYVTLFLSNKDDWVLFTPNGYYDASPGGEQFIGWHINRERHETALFYTVDQFRASLYRPDVIDAVIDTRDEQEALQSARGDLVAVLDTPYPEVSEAPRVEFLQPKATLTTRSKRIEAVFTVNYASDDPVRRVDLRVGDRVSNDLPEVVNETASGDRVTLTYRVSVNPPAGTSFLTATAFGRTMTSAPARVEIRRPVQAAGENAPRLFVLAVGLSKYAESDYNLDWAAKDASDFAKAWQDQQQRFYSSVETKVLTNEEATVSGIREGIGWLADRTDMRPYDVAIVYLAGHGLFSNRGRWYFGGHELDLERLRTTAIPQSELVDLIDRDLTCRTLLFADTCHATGIRETQSARRTHPQGRDPWLGMRCMSMVSCTARQESVESEAWQNGAFTEAILAALREPSADLDRDGRLSFDELQIFVKRTTKRLAQTLGFEQTPAVQLPSFVSSVFLAAASSG